MQKEFMQRAIELAKIGMDQNHGGPFGCVIVRDNKIIAEGYNQVLCLNDPTAHAEVMAIRNACKEAQNFLLEDCELYTSCEPCPMCLSAIYWAHIPKVYYAATRHDAAVIGFDDDFIYQELELDAESRRIKMSHYPDAKAQQVFNEWHEKSDKTPY